MDLNQQIMATIAKHDSRIADVVDEEYDAIFITLHSDLSAAAAMAVVVDFAALRPSEISMTDEFQFRIWWD